MITKTINIANGVNVNYIETEKFKMNSISFNFITGLKRENAHINTLLTRVLIHGSKNYPTQKDIDKRLQYLYASSLSRRSHTCGKYHVFGLCADMLNDRFTEDISVTDEMVALLCDVVFNPIIENDSLSAKNTEDEKLEMIDLINAEINNKARYAQKSCFDIMCENEVTSISVLGEVKDVQCVDAKILYDAYKKALKECRVEIYVVGNLDADRVANTFKTYFDKIERNVETVDDIEIVRSATSVKNVEEIQDVAQGKLCMGFRTGKTIEDGDYHIAQLFNELYGGSPMSKLFVNVREKKSLCYTCSSFIMQKSGILRVLAGIEASNKQIAIDAILEQLECVKNAEITDDELENAKKSLKNSYMNVYDSPYAMESWTYVRSLSNNYDIPLEEARKIEKVTKEEIAEYAKGITLDTIYFLKGEDSND